MSEETPVQENSIPEQSYPVTLVPAGCSPTIALLAAALAEAQGDIAPAPKDSTNPHFKSRYADLASVREASRAALRANGLAIIQRPFATAGRVEVETMLVHKSGEWIVNTLRMPLKDEHPHAVGSAITYARRYSYCALLGVVADEDDDGNSARAMTPPDDRDRSRAPTPKAPPKAKAPPPEKTQPTSDRPPPPEASDEPCSPATLGEIKKFMLALNIQRTEKIAMMKSVLGKSPEEQPTEDDGQKMLAHLRNMAEADGVVVE
jgi:hypothetical protein